MIYRIFTALAVLAVIAGSLFLARQQPEIETPAPVGRPGTELGYSARDAQIVETGIDGRPLYTLNAHLIHQQPQDNTVQLDLVRMNFNDADGNGWTLRAQHGEMLNEGAQIDASGDVHVSGILPGTQQPAEITSDKLSFDTREQVVSTHDPVTLSWAGRELHSLGLTARLKERHVQLESSVHGLFLP